MSRFPDSDPFNTTPEILPLAEAIDMLSHREDLILFDHKTGTAERGASIVREGLRLRSPYIYSTADTLYTTASRADATALNEEYITRVTHANSHCDVIIGVERLTDSEIPHRKYHMSIVQRFRESQGPGREYMSDHMIDRRFIAGYFDLNAGQYVMNPNFDPTWDPNLLETTSDMDIVRERNPVILPNFGRARSFRPQAPNETAQTNLPPLPTVSDDFDGPIVY